MSASTFDVFELLNFEPEILAEIIKKCEAEERLFQSPHLKSENPELHKSIELKRKEKFTEHFGALSEQETGKHSFSYYYQNTLKRLSGYSIFNEIRWEGHLPAQYLLSIKLNLDYPCRRGCCDLKFHRRMAAQMTNLFAYQEFIYKEFLYKQLDTKHPLQDLRDRGCRVLTLQKERTILYLEASFHLMQQKAIIEQKLIYPIPLRGNRGTVTIPTDDFVNYSLFTKQKSHTFRVLPIRYHGTRRYVSIRGGFKAKKLSGNELIESKLNKHTYFCIYDYLTNELLGSMALHKTWQAVHESDWKPYPMIDTVNEYNYNPPEKVTPYCLAVTRVKTASLEKEPDTGALPILEMLTEIAVTVFLHENFQKLRVNASGAQAYVFYAGGFRGRFDEIPFKKAFRKARKKGMIYPPLDKTQHMTMWLEKGTLESSSSSETASTTLISRSIKEAMPAKVDFTTDEKKLTWGEKISQTQLLGPIAGPILPQYNYRNIC